ncbi:MAG: Uncharacterised protein [SAR116 cluster bacterium]|nr:MAG: Uncharacterised protein [SAR116 cluster bacterium]
MFGKFLAVEMRQPGGKIPAIGLAELGFDCPVFLSNKSFNLCLALADQPQGNRLYAACGSCAWQLPPQYRRDRKSDQIIKGPPRAVSIDQFHIELAWLFHRGQDGA